jgi:hypothetical protein
MAQDNEARMARALQKLSNARYTTCLRAVQTKLQALIASGEAEHLGIASKLCREQSAAGNLAYFNLKREGPPDDP